mgnify:CR=1 FL=1
MENFKGGGSGVPAVGAILENNGNQSNLKEEAGEKGKDPFSESSSIVLDQAMLADGGTLEDPATFVVKLNNLILDLSQNT